MTTAARPQWSKTIVKEVSAMAGQAQCPICDVSIVPASDVQASQVISCPDCGSDLEIKNLDPLVLAEAPRVEEDWGE